MPGEPDGKTGSFLARVFRAVHCSQSHLAPGATRFFHVARPGAHGLAA
jgi:hypothetical protein